MGSRCWHAVGSLRRAASSPRAWARIPRALGITESILSYCAKVEAAAAAKYQEKVRQVTDGASDEGLVKVRGSDEYQRARQSMEDFVKKVDEHNAKQLCSNGLAPHR